MNNCNHLLCVTPAHPLFTMENLAGVWVFEMMAHPKYFYDKLD
jgi:hypothetical protein